MSLTDEVQAQEKLRLRNEQFARDNGQLRKRVSELTAERDKLEQIAAAAVRPLKPPKWLTKKPKRGEHIATVCSMLSDTHFDEVVSPSELDGFNAYNREIAEQRLERFFEHTVYLARDYLSGVTYEGLVLILGGDIVSGEIHDEFLETNEATTPETVVHWTERIAAGIGFLADEFGRVHVPATVGNHGRFTRKPYSKRRVRRNWDWLISQWLAREFKDDERVTFTIPDAPDVPIDLYETRLLLNHGNETSGGGGIGGIWPPLMRMLTRKRNRYQFDTLVMGHWHTYVHAPEQGLIVNGSLKGYDEYARDHNFTVERAQQALWVVTPEHGVTFAAPVIVEDRAKEGW